MIHIMRKEIRILITIKKMQKQYKAKYKDSWRNTLVIKTLISNNFFCSSYSK